MSCNLPGFEVGYCRFTVCMHKQLFNICVNSLRVNSSCADNFLILHISLALVMFMILARVTFLLRDYLFCLCTEIRSMSRLKLLLFDKLASSS